MENPDNNKIFLHDLLLQLCFENINKSEFIESN